MSIDIRGRRMLRLAAVMFLAGLAAATRPAGTVAQEAPMRWDGSIEHLSANDPDVWDDNQPSGAARMSRHPMSRDGRHVVFGADISYDPYQSTPAIFKRDRLTGDSETFYVGTLEPPVISADGNHIAFQWCDPWMRSDNAPVCDIYILGSAYGSLLNASTTPLGDLSNDTSEDPVLSPDGRFLVFRTRSTTLLPAGAAPGQLVIRDRDADGNGVFDEPGQDKVTIEVVSLSDGQAPGDNISGSAEISTDGRFIAFRSLASNLVPDDTNNAWDVFLRDRSGAGVTRRINVGWDGQQATPTLDSSAISMNESGDVIAFATDDTYLVNPPTHNVPDTNNGLDIVVYDRHSNTLERIDIGAEPGEQGNGHTYWPTLSENGQYISLVSTSANAAGLPVTPGRAHVYVYDRITRQTTRVSMTAGGAEPDADSAFAAISGDASIVLFTSVAGLAPTSTGLNAIYGAAHFEVAPDELTIPGRGGSVSLTITAQQYVKWRVDFEDWNTYNWLQYESMPWGNGSGSVTFSAYSNNEPTSRTAWLKIGLKRVLVTQEAGLSLSSMTPSSGPETGGTVVTLTGTGFEPDTQAHVEGVGMETEFVDSTTLRLTMPPHAPGSVYLYVQSSDFRYGALAEVFRYLDTTPPQVMPYVNGTQTPSGWYTSDVTIDWFAYDPDTEVTSRTGCTQSVITTDTNNGAVWFTCTATSEGGTTTESVMIRRDATPPVTHIHKPDETLYRLNSTELAYPMCWDSASGLASCTATRPSGQPLDTSTPGYHLFTVQAADFAGLASMSSRTYAVSSGVCDARPEGLIAWWPGDYDYRDVIGGHDGVLTNSQLPEFVGGISRGSMRFMFPDGKWVQVGDTPALELQNAMTLSAWIYSGGTSSIGVIAGREGEYLLGRHEDGRIRYSIANTDPGWGWVDTNVYVDQSVWTHLALTYDGAEIRLYKNGQQAYSRPASGEIGDAAPTMNDFRIGARQDPADPSEYGGNIDNVEVAGRAFTPAEIESSFFAAPHGHCVDESALVLDPSPQRAMWGQTSTELVARLTRAGVPEPNTTVWFKFRGVSAGGYRTDANGIVRAPISLPANLAVGTYLNAVEARVDTNAVLAASLATASFVVDKATPVMEWNTPLPIVYGTKLNGAQLNARAYTDTGLNRGDFVYTMAWASAPNAGTHTVSVTFTPWDTAHYTVATRSVTLVVNKADAMVELYGYTVPYHGGPNYVNGYVSGNENTYPGLLPLNITYNGSPDPPVNAGTYEVVGSYPGSENYNAATGTVTLTIEQADATVSATGGTFTYDGQPHAAVVSANRVWGGILTPVNVTYNGSADVPVNAGTYAVVASYAGDANHNAASGTTTVTIVKAPVTVSVSGGTVTYDGAPHAATGSVTGAAAASLGPLTFTYNGSAAVPVNAGSYTVLASFAGDANHNAGSATAALTIEKAAATVTATGATVTYDGAPHAATGTVTGAGGASLGSLAFTYNGAADVPVNAGSYAVLASFAGDANHNAGSATAVLTIEKAAATVTATGATVTYDGAPHAATGTVTGVGGASLGPLTFSYNGAADVPVNAGSYAVLATFTGDANHSAGSATATLTIEKAPSTVSATGGTVTYDGAPHAATGTVTGVGGASLTFTYNGSADVPISAGSYGVVASFAGDANHDPGSATATLTIEKAPATVSATGGTVTYDGAPHAATGTVTGVGGASLGPLTFTYNGSADVPISAGSYAVVASFAGDANHAAASAAATLTIGKAAPTVSVSGGAFTYDGAAHPATGTVTGAGGASVGSLAFDYSGSANAPVSAGDYDVIGSFAGNANYDPASGTATITIEKATPAVQWNQPSAIVYGTALGAVQLNASAIVPGTFSYSPAAGGVLAAGASQPLSATFTPADSVNYNGASAGRTIDVEQAPLTIRGNDATKRFGAPLAALSAAGTGFVNGDSITSLSGTLNLVTSATAQSAVGAYPIVPSGVSSPNYAIGFVNGTLSVIKGAVGVTILASPEPSGLDQPMTFTAAVAAGAPAAGVPEGTISFFDGITLVGTAALSGGSAVLTTAGLPAGARTVEARYSGDGSFETGIGTASHVIRDAATTPALTITSSRNPSTVGQTVILTANVSMTAGPVTGDVEFYSGATLLATRAISAGKATLSTTTLAAGAHPITARYTGLGTTPPSQSGVFVQTVGESGWKNRSTTMTLASSANPSALGTAVVFTASVTGSTANMPAGRIVIMVNGQVVSDQMVTPVSGSTARVTFSVPGLAHGRHTVSATYRGDATYRGSTAQVAQTVN